MNDELKKMEQKASEILDDETRAYLKAWVNAFADGSVHKEAKQIADNEIKNMS